MEYITKIEQIYDGFEKIDKTINKKIEIYMISGAVLLYNNLKQGTKDI